MTARIFLSCDGRRNGQPCRGAYPSTATNPGTARRQAHPLGWSATIVDLPGGAHEYRDTCPSGNHDEEP